MPTGNETGALIMEQKYVAFISYRHMPLDSAAAKALHTHIEQYVIPRGLRKTGKRLGRVFRDLEELPASSNLSDDIYHALDNSEYLIVVCSKDTIESPWVAREVEYFLSHHPQSNAFTVLVSGEPGEVFPEQLTYVVNPDGTKTDVEPLAMDIRADSERTMKKRLHKECKRLFAAMLGCPYDALVMREQRRRRRRMAGIGALVLAVTLAFSGVMLVKNRQIRQKNSQLEAVNQELALKTQQILLRESELLTNNALDAMADGDQSGAIRYSLEALVDESGSRPYYAPAEQALIQALGVLDEGQDHTIINTHLEQNTPVEDVAISADGSRVATVDVYGIVNCFDSKTAAVLWSKNGMADTALMTHEGSDLLILVGTKTEAVSFATGEVVWTYDATQTNYPWATLSQDETTLAFMRRDPDADQLKETYSLVLLDPKTGAVQNTISVAQGNTLLNAESYPRMRFIDHTGTFSPDNRYFVGGYSEEHYGDERLVHVYIADLKTGTSRTLYSQTAKAYTDEDQVWNVSFQADKVLIHRGAEDTLGFLDCYTLDGTQVYSTRCAVEGETIYLNGKGKLAVVGEWAWISRDKYLQVVDLVSGEILNTTNFDAPLVVLEATAADFVRVVTADGQYGFCWRNYLGIIAQAPKVLGKVSTCAFFQNGYLDIRVEDGYVKGVSAKDNGYTLYMNPEDTHTVTIKRAAQLHGYFPTSSAELLKDGDVLASQYTSTLAGGKVAIGPISCQLDGKSAYRFAIIDPKDPTTAQTIYCKTDVLSWEDSYVLPDGSGVLSCNRNGDIVLYNAKGDPTVLSERENVDLTTMGDTTFFASREYSAAGIRESDRAVIAARISEKELCLWINGQPQTTIVAPEGYVLQQIGETVNRFLQVGGNGYVVVSGFKDNADAVVDAFLVYNVAESTWHTVTCEGAEISGASVALSNTSPWLVVLDKTDTVFLYNIADNTLVKSFPMQLPQKSVVQLRCLGAGAFLALRTEDMQVWIYDTATGAVVSRQQLDASAAAVVKFQEDPERNRLYISWGNGGICMDTTQWVLLTEIQEMFYFDAVQNNIYGLSYQEDFTKKCLTIRSLPTRERLIAIAKEILHQ